MRIKKTATIFCMCLGYGLVSLFTAYSLIQKHDKERKSQIDDKATRNIQNHNNQPTKWKSNYTRQHLEIIDPSGVGMYLWKHILQTDIPEYANEGWQQSQIVTKNFKIRYNLGYGLVPEQMVAIHDENILLALNGRDELVAAHAKRWLDYALKLPNLRNLGLLLIGDETCNNQWLKAYLNHAILRVVFLVYESPMVDNKRIFQWPLGVASYRNFPLVNLETLDVSKKRLYICNFIGTTYANSSRLELKQESLSMMNSSKCIFKWRDSWLTEETAETSVFYQHALRNSDLTLSPVGKNAECYRTYEALEFGSIPVIEDKVPETCQNSNLS
uniref:Uncharacterized protein n=1 Tax=Ciona savignyi TaxID=51511 RepID=H2Z1K1_CIOSA